MHLGAQALLAGGACAVGPRITCHQSKRSLCPAAALAWLGCVVPCCLVPYLLLFLELHCVFVSSLGLDILQYLQYVCLIIDVCSICRQPGTDGSEMMA